MGRAELGRALAGAALLLASFFTACSSQPALGQAEIRDANDVGSASPGKTEQERELLRKVASLPSGNPSRVGSTLVTAEAPYTAASGRTCRALHVGEGKQATERLACNDGRAWFFVPDVFGPGSGD